jgi:hypothetical protein
MNSVVVLMIAIVALAVLGIWQRTQITGEESKKRKCPDGIVDLTRQKHRMSVSLPGGSIDGALFKQPTGRRSLLPKRRTLSSSLLDNH